jgi:hypothetical protein
MLNSYQIRTIKKLISKKAKIIRGEKLAPLRLMNALVSAREAHVPEQYLLPFSSSLKRVLDGSRFDRAALPPIVGSLLNKNRLYGAKNLAALEQFAARIAAEFGAAPSEAVLAGEGAALIGLYSDPGAFPAGQWTALLKDGTYANGGRPFKMAPPAEGWSEEIRLGNALWRKPKPELLLTLFARHVGDPDAAPTPPMWPHLGTALMVWKDRIAVTGVLELGIRLGQKDEVERGLAIAAQIFPELEGWAEAERFSIPRWERKYAIPLAARRIIMGERD